MGEYSLLYSTVAALNTTNNNVLTWEKVTSDVIQQWNSVQSRHKQCENENDSEKLYHKLYQRSYSTGRILHETPKCTFSGENGHNVDYRFVSSKSKPCNCHTKSGIPCCLCMQKRKNKMRKKFILVAIPYSITKLNL